MVVRGAAGTGRAAGNGEEGAGQWSRTRARVRRSSWEAPGGGETRRTGVGVRLRLIGPQSIRALARMSDGRVLAAAQHINVIAGGCGM